MAFGNALKSRLDQLSRQRKNVPEILARIQTKAANEAIRTATERTPPTAEDNDPLRGTKTRAGNLKGAWAIDSKPDALVNGINYTSTLANNRIYASYVNDGHRMDMHYVPGLLVNPFNGLLELSDPSAGGIIVGTKTQYVHGKYMREAAFATYRRVVENDLIAELERNFTK